MRKKLRVNVRHMLGADLGRWRTRQSLGVGSKIKQGGSVWFVLAHGWEGNDFVVHVA